MPLIRYESLECDLPSDEQQDELMSVHVLIDFGIPWQMNPFLKDSLRGEMRRRFSGFTDTDRLNMCKSENPGAISFSFHCAWPE